MASPSIRPATREPFEVRLEDSLTVVANWIVRHDVQTEVARRASCPVPASHGWLLARIATCGPCRPSDLADFFGVDNSTITPKLQRLEAEDLVRRHADPEDRRAVLVASTAAGSRLLAKLRRARAELLTERMGSLPGPRRAAVATALADLASVLAEDPRRSRDR